MIVEDFVSRRNIKRNTLNYEKIFLLPVAALFMSTASFSSTIEECAGEYSQNISVDSSRLKSNLYDDLFSILLSVDKKIKDLPSESTSLTSQTVNVDEPKSSNVRNEAIQSINCEADKERKKLLEEYKTSLNFSRELCQEDFAIEAKTNLVPRL